jgi:hypothetical protein
MHLIIRHEFDGGISEYTQERRRVTLKEPSDPRFFVYLRSSAEGPTPCTWQTGCQHNRFMGGARVKKRGRRMTQDAPAYFWNSGFEA